jgi:hypothetical protein
VFLYGTLAGSVPSTQPLNIAWPNVARLGLLQIQGYDMPGSGLRCNLSLFKRRRLMSILPRTNKLAPWSISQRLFSRSRNYQYFMEFLGSLSCSQEPTTELYPEADVSSQLSNPISVSSILILSHVLVTIGGVWIGNWIY